MRWTERAPTGVAVPALAGCVLLRVKLFRANEPNLLDARTPDNLERKPGIGWRITPEMSTLPTGFRWHQSALAPPPCSVIEPMTKARSLNRAEIGPDASVQ